MIGIIGIDIYQVFKDICKLGKKSFDRRKAEREYRTQVRNVDLKYANKSGLQEQLEKSGYSIAWKRVNKVETLKIEGWEIMYQTDESERIRYQLIVNNELTLMGRKSGS